MRLRHTLLLCATILATGVLVSQAQVPGVNSTLNSVFTLAYDNSTMKPSYTSTSGGFVVAASATDVCSMGGSATKTVKVRRVMVGGQAAAAITEPVELVKRGAVPTGGTQALDPVISYDTNNVASTVNVEHFTANITLGTTPSVGPIAALLVPFGNFTTGGAASVVFELGQRAQPVVLRGTTQWLAVNLLGSTPGGLTLYCTWEWTEE